MISIKKKMVMNLSGYGYSQAITILSQIIAVPFYLSSWGVALYGEWLVLTGIPMFMALMQLGVAQASATRASLASGRNDIFGMRASLDTAMFFSALASLIIVLIGGVAASKISWENVLSLSNIKNSEASSIIFFMSIYLAGNFMAGPIVAWLKAIDRTSTAAFFMANRRALELFIIIILLTLKADPVFLSLSMMLSSIITTIAFYFLASKYSPFGLVKFNNASFIEFRSVFVPAISCMVYPLTLTITSQGGIQILNILSGSYAVAAFSMARTMVRLLMQVGIVFNNAMRPEVSRLLGQNNALSAAAVVKKGSFIAITISVIGLFFLAVIGPYVINVWSRGDVSFSSSYLVLLATHCVANVIWFVPSTLLYAKNEHVLLSMFYISFSSVSIFTWWICRDLVDPFVGVAFMMLIPEVLMIILICFMVKSEFSSDKVFRNSHI